MITPAVLIPKKDLPERASNHDAKQYNSTTDKATVSDVSGRYAMLRIIAITPPAAIAKGDKMCIHAFLLRIFANRPSL
tara:strand:+ start:629 stop:862 length:234 start_codon:yes stop_codon:yes gene_type:complete